MDPLLGSTKSDERGARPVKARDLMTRSPAAVTPHEPIARAAEIMHDLDVGIVPVVDNQSSKRLLGVITDRDITVRCVAKKHGSGCSVKDHMTSQHLDTVHCEDDASTVISLMEREQVRRIPVVSGDNRLEGIIAQADLARKLGPKEPLKVEEVLERVSAAHASLSG